MVSVLFEYSSISGTKTDNPFSDIPFVYILLARVIDAFMFSDFCE